MLIRSNSVYINGETYRVAGDRIRKKTIFPEQNYQVFKDFNKPDPSDMHPAIQTYEIRDCAEGSGLYVDHGKDFSRRAWFSTLNHSLEDQLTIADRRQSAGTIAHTNFLIHYKNEIYALTDSGLYIFDDGAGTWGAVAGTPANGMYHACVHRQYLVIARGSANNIVLFDGTNFTNPVVAQKGYLVADLEDRLFAVENQDANGLLAVKYTADLGATTWSNAIFVGSTQSKIPSSSEGLGIAVGPDGSGKNQLFVSTSSAVWMVDYELGRLTMIHDMGHNHYASNGKVLIFWPSTRKLYVSEASTIVEIDLFGETKPVGPSPSAVPVSAIPNGLPTDYLADYIRCATYNANYIAIGTQPISGDTALIMKMTPDHKWYFMTKHATASEGIRAILFNSNFGRRIYWMEGSGGDDDARYMDFGGDFAEEGELHTPWLTMGLPQLPKCFYELIAELRDLTETEIVTYSYRLNYDDTTSYNFQAITSASATTSRTFAQSTEIGIEAKAIKIIIKCNRGGNVALAPKVLNTRIRWRPHPPSVDLYEFDILASEGTDYYSNLLDLEDTLASAFTDRCSVSFIPSGDASDSSHVVTVIPIGNLPTIQYDERRKSDVIHVQLMAVGDFLSGVAGVSQTGVGTGGDIVTSDNTHIHTRDDFTGDALETTFTLLHTPLYPIEVFIDSIYQDSSTFTVTGDDVIFDSAPGNLLAIEIHYAYAVGD